MNFEKLFNIFVSSCFLNKIVFTEHDILHFAKTCNVRPNPKLLHECKSELKYPNYVCQKSLLGPCFFRPKDVYIKDVNYNIGKIINDLQLSRQNMSVDAKMEKIVTYIKFLS